MKDFNITNFALNSNPEAQKSGVGSNITKYENRVVCTIGTRPQNGSTFSRLKYRLAEQYKRGDDFWITMDLELPSNFYAQQNGSLRLIGLWHNVEYGRLGLWIDSDQRPRIQREGKDKRLVSPPLWTGKARQYPVGRHKLKLHIVLGSLTELYVDTELIISISGNNMPYPEYSPNQILFMFDGANANTKTITATCYGIEGKEANSCRDLQLAYLDAETEATRAEAVADSAYENYKHANEYLVTASSARDVALAKWEACITSQ